MAPGVFEGESTRLAGIFLKTVVDRRSASYLTIVDQKIRFAKLVVFRRLNRVAHPPLLLLPSCQT